ncbi:hypothetical protein DYBT9275_04190 [Dyadobacter sp. CECT 9275]|uniref:Type II toxin-antitoxin system RelE/ParE family toxin n=1 Tax=Dyadobacter helix TaxID=2822344 RepID=A0A916JHN0_9BACT|nr:hypothetical protein DYBT9275_04190 [Dyadobacter sp. CECT 9275]
MDNFHGVITYLEENWDGTVIRDFVLRTEKVILLISEHPEMFRQISESNTIREAVITKHNLLLYKVFNNKIVLLAIFDTRQHPRKKKI